QNKIALFLLLGSREPFCSCGYLPVMRNYRITLSALAKTFGGIVRSICFAAFKLITRSNLAGCSIGRSAGLAPYFVNVSRCAPVQVGQAHAVAHESKAFFHDDGRLIVHHREPVL